MGTLRRKIRKIKYKVEDLLAPATPKKEIPPEPDLLYRMQLIELMGKGLSVNDISYIPEEVKVYEDRIWFRISRGADGDLVSQEIVCPRSAGERTVSFTVCGQALLWDVADRALRFSPAFDPTACAALNPWVSILDSRVVRVEREYALHNLSPECLAYAFADNGDSFDWCIADFSCSPLVFELNPVFWSAYNALSGTYLSAHVQDNFNLLSMYAASFGIHAGLNADNFIERYKQQAVRPLWEPDTSTAE